MGSTTRKPRRHKPPLDSSWGDQVRRVHAERIAADPNASVAGTARATGFSPSTVAKFLKERPVEGHDPRGGWGLWLNSPELGGEQRYLGRVAGTTTLDPAEAARFPSDELARRFAAEHEDEMVGVNISLSSTRPFPVGLPAAGAEEGGRP